MWDSQQNPSLGELNHTNTREVVIRWNFNHIRRQHNIQEPIAKPCPTRSQFKSVARWDHKLYCMIFL